MEKRINNVEELEKIYYQNCGRIMHGEYSVLGHGLRPFTLVQEICYLYKLNNEKMCQALDEVLKEYKVTYDIRTLDISDIPNEICELIREKYRKYRNNNLSNTKEKEIATKEKILNELNEF